MMRAGVESASGIEWLVPDWPAPGGVRALSTRRAGGVSEGRHASLNLGDHVGDAPAAVAENRRRLEKAAGLPAQPMWLAQVHGTRVIDLDEGSGPAEHGSKPEADAALTRRPGRVCAILSADCLPILLTTNAGGVVAAAHAGWRGLSGGVIEAAVAAVRAADAGASGGGGIMAWLGPAIGPAHFEVGAEVREAVLAGDPGAAEAFAPNPGGRLMADLGLLARRRLRAAGVERVYGGGECTYSHPAGYFSHRRDGTSGRQATLIWLTSEARIS